MSCVVIKYLVCADIKVIGYIIGYKSQILLDTNFLIKEGKNEESNLTKDYAVKACKILQGKL